MSEYINKADMWEAYENSKDDVDMAEQFERLPTIDIVTCKDCINWEQNGYSYYGYCNARWYGQFSPEWDINIRIRTNPDYFCADGERKE